jgi:lysophospholipase L1-like esterase
MKKEILLITSSVLFSVILALVTIRFYAPQLLGIPPDLKLVRLDEAVPPFYEGVFRDIHNDEKSFLINDPITLVRPQPLYPATYGTGPHDILGFRNNGVPNISDIITIGDSQTYGNNAVYKENWPSQLSHLLEDKQPVVYSMAVGGWGAIQYLDMFSYAALFQPRIVIVAYYSGNDSLESFRMAYGTEKWRFLIPDQSLTEDDMPQVNFPAPKSEWWPVTFKDGITTIFTPKLRLGSNQDHAAVKAGYKIMANVARLINESATKARIKVIFTIIPTKELVYLEKIRKEGITPPDDYTMLVRQEQDNIKRLVENIVSLPNASYVDVVTHLQKAALEQISLYPSSINGHPNSTGYGKIAQSLARVAEPILPEKPRGLVALQIGTDTFKPMLVNDEGAWPFASNEIIAANGWQPGTVPTIQPRDIADIPLHNAITIVDPEQFGPASIMH